MIPSVGGLLQGVEAEEQPSLTYRMDPGGDSVRGYADGREAVRQAVFRILQTERYQYVIYPWWYGIETLDLYGEPVNWVCAELERRITEALLMDSRITGVSDFRHDTGTGRKGAVHTAFTVHTVYGDLEAEREVQI